jgi:hypothetical protein
MNSVCRLFYPLTPTLSRWERELTAPDFRETTLIMVGMPRVNHPARSMQEVNSLSLWERARVRGFKTPLQRLLTNELGVKEGNS